ncbi:MAG: hypothetical protein KF784_11700 [Fimbriimonadaceae bacterium]|nr:hypothetical protein [Fimbriimonadaceae bacterium]
MLPLLLLSTTPISPDTAVLKQAYAQAQECDWDSEEGQRAAWRIIGDSLAKITINWPINKMSSVTISSRIDRLVKQADMEDQSNRIEESLLTMPFCTRISPRTVKDGIVCLVGIRRRNSYDELGAIFFIRREQSGMVASILKTGNSDSTLPGPTAAIMTQKGLIVTGMQHWYGNRPSSAISVFQRWPMRWARTLHRETSFESWRIDKPRRVAGTKFAYEAMAIGRKYPRNVSTSHANANVEMCARFFFDGNHLYMREWRGENAWAKFDDLIGAVVRGRKGEVQRICLRKRDAEELMKFRGELEGGLNAFNSDSNCSIRDYDFLLPDIRKRFHFIRKDSEWRLAKLTTYKPHP